MAVGPKFLAITAPSASSDGCGEKTMTRLGKMLATCALVAVTAVAAAAPSVYPTGHDDLRSGTHLERLHGAVGARHASRDRHRHERQRRQTLGRLQRLRRRPGASAAGRRHHRRGRGPPAAPRVARARAARLRRQRRLALRPQPRDRDGRRQEDLGRCGSITTGSERIFRPAITRPRRSPRSPAARR